MTTCATCLHWEPDNHPGNEDCPIRRCGLLTYSRGCNAALDCNKQTVYTAPTFGCILHEPKDTT